MSCMMEFDVRAIFDVRSVLFDVAAHHLSQGCFLG